MSRNGKGRGWIRTAQRVRSFFILKKLTFLTEDSILKKEATVVDLYRYYEQESTPSTWEDLKTIVVFLARSLWNFFLWVLNEIIQVPPVDPDDPQFTTLP